MRYGASGEVHIVEREARVIRADVMALALGADDEYTTGGAHGTDTVAAVAAAEAFRDCLHRLVLPQGWYNRAIRGMVLKAWVRAHGPQTRACRFEVIEMPERTDYMDRNSEMARHIDILDAWPREAEEQRRSGTWATVRRVRRLGGEARIHALEELDV